MAAFDKRIRVLLADSHRLVVQSCAALLGAQAHLEVVAQVSDGEDALAGIRTLLPDVAVLEVAMPRLTGVEIARKTRESGLVTRVVILSAHDEPSVVRESLRAGVAGYVAKDGDAWELIEAIQVAAWGGAYFSPAIAKIVAREAQAGPQGDGPELTPREREVLRLVAEGLSSKEIAARLSLSTRTVEGFRKHLMHKLCIHDIAGLVKYALAHHLVALRE